MSDIAQQMDDLTQTLREMEMNEHHKSLFPHMRVLRAQISASELDICYAACGPFNPKCMDECLSAFR